MPSVKKTTLGTLAKLTGAELRGDANRVIEGVATLEKAKSSDLAFLTSPLYERFVKDSGAGCILLSPQAASLTDAAVLIHPSPRLAYVTIVNSIALETDQAATQTGIHPSAVMGQRCQISDTAYIGPNCVLGDDVCIGDRVVLQANNQVGNRSRIGDRSYLYPGVVLYHDVQLGSDAMIHANTVIGSDGFGFEPDAKGHWHKVPQIGGVRIGDGVDIGANTTIDRGAVDDTVIGNGVILDNLIQIAHNVVIGDYTAIAACVGISGSAHIGRHCLIGGGACVKGHIEIADGVLISGMSMVTKSISTPGQYSSGIPVREKKLWLRNVTRFHQLDAMAKRLTKLEKSLNKREEI